MTFLAIVVVLIFSFAFVVEEPARPRPSWRASCGSRWWSRAPSGLARAFDREREGEAIRSLLLTPAPRAAIYLGKLAATAALMTITQTVLTGLAGVLFSTSFAAVAGRVALLLVLGIIGFAAAGCVFSAALLRARGRDALLATLLYPIIVPIVIAGARGTTQLIDPVAPDFDGARFWTQFLVAVDILFITAGVWAFEPIAASD